MEAQLQALDAVLRDELALVRALVGRLPYKMAVIRKNLVEQLARVTEAEAVDQQRLAQLEQSREDVLRDLCEALCVPHTSRLVELSGLLPSPWKQHFDATGLELKAAVEALRGGHESCQAMLRAATETVELTMSLVADRMRDSRVRLYGNAPRESDAPARSSVLLDWRA